ncbi:hypothetical protein DY000_02008450 [Brassica cretica]|uniref:Uncharacterized protein n=1 Tax=Brassica cretica TaxID=69181 RepID=A0ABQ7C641_BRACR|nr:hypothetical protein DY000_02008450 [Brassica cretica]
MAILELIRRRFGYVFVAFGQSVFSGSIEIRTRFYRKALRKDFFTKIAFRKNVHADFYGLSDIDSVVTDFDPNSSYVATDPSRTRWLLSDQTVSDIDQRVRPKSVHSRLFLNASSRVPQSYHLSLLSIGVII